MGIPELILEQFFLKEKKQTPDSDVQESLAAIKTSNEEILQAYPADKMKEAVLAKIAAGKLGMAQKTNHILPFAQKRTRSANFRFATFAAAVCCVAILSLLTLRTSIFTSREDSGITMENGVRVKGGGQRLFVYKKLSDKAVLLQAKAAVAVNDIVQISYIAGGDTFGAIFSVDGNGVITQHFPDSGEMTAKLSNDGEVSLDFSYKLDNAPKFERFIFISGTEKFSIAQYKKTITLSAATNEIGTFDIAAALPVKSHVTDILLLK